MKTTKSITLGIIIGVAATLSITALAEYIVNPNTYPVLVDGQQANIEGYNINDSTYFKLRDIGDKVGFSVDFADDTILLSTEPSPTPTPQSISTVDVSAYIVKGEDGKDYTVDGIEVEYVDGIAYIDETDVRYILNDKGLSNYSFSTTSLVKFEDNTFKKVIADIPRCESDHRLIELKFYISTLLPFINSL